MYCVTWLRVHDPQCPGAPGVTNPALVIMNLDINVFAKCVQLFNTHFSNKPFLTGDHLYLSGRNENMSLTFVIN